MTPVIDTQGSSVLKRLSFKHNLNMSIIHKYNADPKIKGIFSKKTNEKESNIGLKVGGQDPNTLGKGTALSRELKHHTSREYTF